MYLNIMSLNSNNHFDPKLPPFDPNVNRAYNQYTRTHDDVCEYENQLVMGSKPIKYFVNQLNSPQSVDFMEFTPVGNQQVYGVQNTYDHALPTRLNALDQLYVFPYSTSPYLGQASPSREYADTDSNLRFGTDIRSKKSAVAASEIDYNRWDFVDAQTVQNSGQFGSFQSSGQGIDRDLYFDYKAQNNVLFANSAFPYFGISSRNELYNSSAMNGC